MSADTSIEDGPMRMLIGLLLIIGGVVAVTSGAITGDFGDRHLWLVVLGGSAVFFGIGMLLRGAIRLAVFMIAGLLLFYGAGLGLFDLFS